MIPRLPVVTLEAWIGHARLTRAAFPDGLHGDATSSSIQGKKTAKEGGELAAFEAASRPNGSRGPRRMLTWLFFCPLSAEVAWPGCSVRTAPKIDRDRPPPTWWARKNRKSSRNGATVHEAHDARQARVRRCRGLKRIFLFYRLA